MENYKENYINYKHFFIRLHDYSYLCNKLLMECFIKQLAKHVSLCLFGMQ